MTPSRVLVTGSSGMIGRQVLAVLARTSAQIVATGRTRPEGLTKEMQWTPWDLIDWRTPSDLDKTFGRINAVIHCGAVVPGAGRDFCNRDLMNANVIACLCLGEWAVSSDIPIVFISGATVYADPERPGISEDAPKGLNSVGGFYGTTKLLAEMVFSFLRQRGARVAILRPSSVYGPGMAGDKMIVKFLAAASRSETIVLEPPVEDRVDLVYSGDVARATLLALQHDAWGDFNIGSGALASIAEIAESCIRAVGRGTVRLPLTSGDRPPRVRFALDLARARERLGYFPKVPLDAGLASMSDDTVSNNGKIRSSASPT